MKLKKNAVLLLCLMAGVMVGTLVGNFASGVSFLKFLSYHQTVGIPTAQPFLLDLLILKLSLGLEITVSLAQLVFLFLALLFHQKLVKK